MVDPNDPRFESLFRFHRLYAFPTESELPVTADGGYPLVYYTEDNGLLCADCANGKNGSMTMDPETQDDPQWMLVDAHIHFEGPGMVCDHCGASIASAYGDPSNE